MVLEINCYPAHPETLDVLAAHATVKSSDRDSPPENQVFYQSFWRFVKAFEAGGLATDYLLHPTSEQTLAFNKFWKEHKRVDRKYLQVSISAWSARRSGN